MGKESVEGPCGVSLCVFTGLSALLRRGSLPGLAMRSTRPTGVTGEEKCSSAAMPCKGV